MLIVQLYLTLMPVIIAGVLNMVWVKLNVAKILDKPIDQGFLLSDGKRVFGDNKTWKGFLGYLLWGSISGIFWGWLCSKVTFLEQHNLLYTYYNNAFIYNWVLGLGFGFAYGICELPNSFLKRRFDVRPGKLSNGFRKIFFFILDQVDSLFGCVGVVTLVYPMNLSLYLLTVFLGGLTHIGVNLVIYMTGIRKNMF